MISFLIGCAFLGIFLGIILSPIVFIAERQKIKEIKNEVENNPDGGNELKKKLLKKKNKITTGKNRQEAQDYIDLL